MKIVLEPNNTHCKEECAICGDTFRAGDILPVIEGSEHGICRDYVCDECIVAGPNGMRKRARLRAEKYGRIADTAKTFADKLDASDIDAPTVQQIQDQIDIATAAEMGITIDQLPAAKEWINYDTFGGEDDPCPTCPDPRPKAAYSEFPF